MDHLLLLLGISDGDAVFVPLNYPLATAELADIIEDADMKLLPTSDPTMAALKVEIQPLPGKEVVLAATLGKA